MQELCCFEVRDAHKNFDSLLFTRQGAGQYVPRLIRVSHSHLHAHKYYIKAPSSAQFEALSIVHTWCLAPDLQERAFLCSKLLTE